MDLPLNVPPSDVSPKRRQIVTAAEELFLAHGYGSVSMDAIARLANVSKATLYAHFASKDALFAGIMAEKGTLSPIADELFPAEVEDISAALTLIGRSVLEFMLQERTLSIYRVAIAESARFPELGVAFFNNGPQRFFERFRSWIIAQTDAGQLAARDPARASHQFMALLRSCVFMRASLAVPPAPTMDEIVVTVEGAVDTFLKAFGPPA